MKTRALLLLLAAAAAAGALRAAGAAHSAPVIVEPASEGQVLSPFDVHMVTGPFVGDPGETHVCSDWEIRTVAADQAVWTAPCATGALAVHIHLGDGQFTGSLAGRHQLATSTEYRVRVRFVARETSGEEEASGWTERRFVTTPGTAILPLVVSDVSAIPAVRWDDAAGAPIVLPPGASLELEGASGGTVLTLAGVEGGGIAVVNPPALPAHGNLRIRANASGAGLAVPASRLAFTDGKGEDRVIVLPEISLGAAATGAWWISEAGGAFTDATGGAVGAPPDFTTPVTQPEVPWAVKQPGFRVEKAAADLMLPINIAFVPNPGTAPDAPFYYVTELYGTVKVVTRSGQVRDYATGLLNFDPTGGFPGSGEKGMTGIAVEPGTGDVFVAFVYEIPGVADFHFPKVIRLHSTDGGLTASSQTTVLEFPDEPMGPSHQISNLSFGPDGKLYVHMGDGLLTWPALDLHSVRGKILRVNPDGTPAADNPFYDASDSVPQADYVFAYGVRNPFGGAWRAADGALWEVENGPGTDRLAKVVRGRNFLWNGTEASMGNHAAYVWIPAHAPVNIAFVQASTFGGSGFPAEKLDHAFVTESGATYAPGPQETGKRIVEFVFDADGRRTAGPTPLVEYVGAGRATATALAAGPDGLYFADLYKDFGAASPVERGASVFRIRYAGIADFAAESASGRAPLAVRFRDLSNVPGASAWHWEFGDGEVSDQREPEHVYQTAGTFDVRLTVTGSGGAAVRQKSGVATVAPSGRVLQPIPGTRPAPRILERPPQPTP